MLNIPDLSRKVVAPKCKLGANDCQVLKGARIEEICSKCKMVSRGRSVTTDEELHTPKHYIGLPTAKVTHIRRKSK